MKTRNLLGFVFGPLAAAAFSLMAIPAMAWAFSPEDVGRFNILSISVSLAMLLFTLGLDQSYVREYHEVLDHAALLRSCVAPGLLFFSVFALAGLAFATDISWWLFGAEDPTYYWWLVGCALIAILARYLSLILRMQERGLAFSLSQIVPKAVLLLLIVLIVVADLPRHFIQLQVVLFGSTAAGFLIFLWNTHRQWVPAFRSRIDTRHLRSMVRFGLPLNLAGLAYWGLAATSALTLRTLSSFTELGIYSVAMSVAGVAAIFQSIFTVIWAPVVYKWAAQGADMARVDKVSRQALAAVVGIFVLVGSFSWLVDFVLPNQYDHVKYFVVCSIAQPLLYTLSEVTCVGIGITRRTMFSLWATLTGLLVNLGLNILLVPSHGASGAVIANAIAYFVFFVARTEASAYVWRQFPRAKLYLFVSAAVSLAVATVVLGPSTGKAYSIVWVVVAPLVLYSFRVEVRSVSSALLSTVNRAR